MGRLTTVAASGVSTNFYSYDALGRVAISSQTPAGGQPYPFTYAYNLAGALISETYPSGRVVKTGYDAVNRVSAMTGTLGGQEKSYMSVFEYIAATGAPGGFFYGNNVAPVYSYNSRLQANDFYATNGNSPDHYLLYSGYDWGTGNNNGTLHGTSEYYGNSVAFGALSQISQSYTYDGVKRLKTVTDSGYTQAFAYDQYGNMTTGGVAWDAASSTAGTMYTNNQAGPGCGTAGSVYDCAGNQVVVNGNTLVYDAENRQVSATSPAALGGGTESYFYDGNGQRVEKSGPGGTTYVYDAFGQLAAEYGASNGTSPCLTCYLTWDALGSTRLVTGESGQVIGRHDYLAFGGEIPASTAGRTTDWGGLKDNIAQKFTGKERDSETGLDFFGARYYGAALGRFVSVDPMNAGADPTNPQSWNAYAYVLNNPLANVDPSGRDCQGNDDGVPCIVDNPPPPPPDPCDFDVFCGLPIQYPYPTSQPPPPQPTPSQTGGQAPAKNGNVLSCAADFSSAHSIAGGLQALGIGNNGGVGGFLVNTFGGNTFSGITNLVSTLASPNSSSGQVLTQLGRADLRGLTQGIPARLVGLSNSPARYGLSGFVRSSAVGALFNAATGANQTLVTLSGEVALGTTGLTAAEFASGVGEAKFALDFLTFAYGVATCIP